MAFRAFFGNCFGNCFGLDTPTPTPTTSIPLGTYWFSVCLRCVLHASGSVFRDLFLQGNPIYHTGSNPLEDPITSGCNTPPHIPCLCLHRAQYFHDNLLREQENMLTQHLHLTLLLCSAIIVFHLNLLRIFHSTYTLWLYSEYLVTILFSCWACLSWLFALPTVNETIGYSANICYKISAPVARRPVGGPNPADQWGEYQ